MRRFLLTLAALAIAIASDAAVLFEDNFEYSWTFTGTSNGGYYPCTREGGGSCTSATVYEPSAVAEGSRTNDNSWNGWGRTATSYGMAIGSGYGRDSGGGYKLTYPASAGGASTEPRLYKWLGSPGPTEVYLAWWFRFDDDGADRWDWGDGSGGTGFEFLKLLRFYQGVDLGALKDRCDIPGSYSVHPSNYGNYIIPDFNNAKGYSTTGREYLPIIFTTHVQGNWATGSDSYRRDEFKWNYPAPIVANALIAPDSSDGTAVAGAIYNYSEDNALAGEFKNAQTWHHIEFHFKLRDVSVGGDISATYVSSTQFTVAGDQTSAFVNGAELLTRGSGAYSDCATPSQVRVSSSSFGGGVTTVTIYDDPVEVGPVLSVNLTAVAVLTENAPGQMEIWVDGNALGNYHSNSSNIVDSDVIYNNTAHGGLNFLMFGDNHYYLVGHEKTIYVDDVVISTTRIGPDYVIGGASGSATINPAGGGAATINPGAGGSVTFQ